MKGVRMVCAWAGCNASYEVVGRCPEGWHSMIVFDNRESPIVWTTEGPALSMQQMHMLRDSMLCPDHGQALEELLKDIGNKRKTGGSA